jgi:hypothetical protein
MEFKNNPHNYAKMSAEFATEEELNAAIIAFNKDIHRLRNKHRIAELLIVKQCYHNGRTYTSMGVCGSELAVLPMAQVAIEKAIEMNSNLLNRISNIVNFQQNEK